MKGLITIIFCLLSFSLSASTGTGLREVSAIKLRSGEIIENLSLQESTKVLESLSKEENVEIRARVIYPDEILQLFVAKLTKARLTEKSPNPQDYN